MQSLYLFHVEQATKESNYISRTLRYLVRLLLAFPFDAKASQESGAYRSVLPFEPEDGPPRVPISAQAGAYI
jgi:hypothetical protein